MRKRRLASDTIVVSLDSHFSNFHYNQHGKHDLHYDNLVDYSHNSQGKMMWL